MPRLVRSRATRGPKDLDPALAGYLVDGDLDVAIDSLEKRGQDALILWVHSELKPLWTSHRDELLAAAKRRRISPSWGERELDNWEA